jgi:hypothetical protein
MVSAFIRFPHSSGVRKPMPEKHEDHGHSLARWVGVLISFVGFLIGGVAFPFGLWPLVTIGGVLQIVALVAVVVLNAAGFGRPDVWGELKAQATEQRGTA